MKQVSRRPVCQLCPFVSCGLGTSCCLPAHRSPRKPADGTSCPGIQGRRSNLHLEQTWQLCRAQQPLYPRFKGRCEQQICDATSGDRLRHGHGVALCHRSSGTFAGGTCGLGVGINAARDAAKGVLRMQGGLLLVLCLGAWGQTPHYRNVNQK